MSLKLECVPKFEYVGYFPPLLFNKSNTEKSNAGLKSQMMCYRGGKWRQIIRLNVLLITAGS